MLTLGGSLCEVKDDILWPEASLVNGFDAICDLAALSNDPAGQLEPEQTDGHHLEGRDLAGGRTL